MPKKVKPSAFMSFVIEFKRKEENRGYRMNIQQATQKAGDIWKNMSMERREPYEIIAKQTNLTEKPIEKYTSQGQPLSLLEKQQKFGEQKKDEMDREINTIVQEAFLNNTIGSQVFFLIHGNYFCQDLNKEYVPAELAISKFTLLEGSIQKHHLYLNPESLPMGYKLEAKLLSEETHRLPIPPNAMGSRNWAIVLKDIFKFLDGSPTQVPALYTEEKQIPIITSFLKTFCYEANEETEFRIYPLSHLFFALKQESCKYSLEEDSGFQSIHIAKAILERDEYDYRSGIACEYHEDNDASKYCSLSAVMRWGYVMAENISPNAGIENVPGIHVPADEEPRFDEESVVSRRSVLSKFTYCEPTKVKEIDTDVETVCDEKYAKTEDNFPPLGGGRGHSMKSGTESDITSRNDDDGSESMFNAWDTARRKQNNPRAPSESSFKFSQTSRGRGLVINPASSTVTSAATQGRSVGRGKLMQ